ncbi:hypothetical protein CFU_1077 [Collimonas fungivorans Ter331]|uniref:Uncharacterized protein n=1 Tax=Collimonas fungivorans (strain Ter331) TaxID=1005048 RepID=G0AIX6_COLFT|nr:hypothetical protein CFU_1077 [Collimonas fungivorans Ter331]
MVCGLVLLRATGAVTPISQGWAICLRFLFLQQHIEDLAPGNRGLAHCQVDEPGVVIQVFLGLRQI